MCMHQLIQLTVQDLDQRPTNNIFLLIIFEGEVTILLKNQLPTYLSYRSDRDLFNAYKRYAI